MSILNVSLSTDAEARLRQRAAANGQLLEQYATAVLERAATAPSLDEILAPVRRQVEQSGMGDDELDALVQSARDKAFRERQQRGT